MESGEQKSLDLVLMDPKMLELNGIEAARQIRAKPSNVRELVLTTYDDDEWGFDAIRAGASGYLPKSTPRGEFRDWYGVASARPVLSRSRDRRSRAPA